MLPTLLFLWFDSCSSGFEAQETGHESKGQWEKRDREGERGRGGSLGSESRDKLFHRQTNTSPKPGKGKCFQSWATRLFIRRPEWLTESGTWSVSGTGKVHAMLTMAHPLSHPDFCFPGSVDVLRTPASLSPNFPVGPNDSVFLSP